MDLILFFSSSIITKARFIFQMLQQNTDNNKTLFNNFRIPEFNTLNLLYLKKSQQTVYN